MRRGAYRAFWAGSLTEISDLQMLRFGQFWLIFQLTGSPLSRGYLGWPTAILPGVYRGSGDRGSEGILSDDEFEEGDVTHILLLRPAGTTSKLFGALRFSPFPATPHRPAFRSAFRPVCRILQRENGVTVFTAALYLLLPSTQPTD